MNRSSCIAVIPARGGSRRIPRKNLRLFAGQPMLQYAIETAHRSGLFKTILVSSDDDEILSTAERHGAEPLYRPAELADDHTATAPVIAHALEGRKETYACCIYPCTPFLTPELLRDGYDLISAGTSGSVFAASTFDAPIWRAFSKAENGTLQMLWPEHTLTRSQDLLEAWHDAGQFYWVPVASFLVDPRLFSDTSRGVEIPRWRSHDIDTPEDWIRAELVFKALKDVENGRK